MSRLSQPLPSDRLRVGECIVDVPLREVRAPGGRRARRITPKSMGVLLELVAQPGKVVSREALLAAVWPHTLPTDDVVTQAVTQLRKAFAPAPEAGPAPTPYIETIAKGGYRLLVEVEWLAPVAKVHPPATAPTETPVPAADPVLPTAQASPRLRGGWAAIAGAVLVAALLSGFLVWWTRSAADAASSRAPVTDATPAALDIHPRLITSSPGFEISPSLSPDASMVAYVAVPPGQRNIAVMVQTTAPTTPRQLTRPTAEANDYSPTWSPDGRRIAFLRVVPESRCQVMVIPASGGTARNVGDCDPHHFPSFDWTPDGRGLVFGSHGITHDRPGLHLLDLASGEVRALDYDADPSNDDFAPRYSPDGRWIVFVRNSPVGDFWRLPATGGTARRLTRLNAQILGWDWAPSGRALIYAHHHDNASRLYRLELGTGARIDLGIADAEDPAVAANEPALAYVHRTTRFGIYRFELGNDEPGERLFASSGRDRLAAIAPDGHRLAFASDRSGEYRLWWADLRRDGAPALLDGIEPGSRYLPAWSADSQRLLVVGTDTNGSGGPGVFEVTPSSGRITRLELPVDEPLQAVYAPAPDGQEQGVVVVAADPGGRLQLQLLARDGGGWQRRAVLDDVARAQADPAPGRVVFTRPGQAGLWQADLRLTPGSVRPVDPEWPSPGHYRTWTVAESGGVLGIERRADCAALLRHRTGDGGEAPSRCLNAMQRAATYGFSLDPRGDVLYVTVVEHDIGDIGFATWQSPPEVMWPGVVK